MSLRRHRVEDAITGAALRVLRPSARRVLVSAVATATTTWTRWRTWTTNPGGRPGEAVEHHFYWPTYEWSHTDVITGPSSMGLLLTFLVGLALWYLPVSTADAALGWAASSVDVRQRLRAVSPSVRRITRWLGHRAHPVGLAALLAFSLPAALLPPQSPFSLFTAPGMVALLAVAGTGGTETVLTDRMAGLVVPASYLCWYVAGDVVWSGYRLLRS